MAYQRSGPGRRPAAAVFDPRAVPDIRTWLQERGIWPLARCEVVAAEPTAAPPPELPVTEEQVARPWALAVRFDAPPGATCVVEGTAGGVQAASEEAMSLPAITPPISAHGPSWEQLARLRETGERLEAARPPRLWGDFTDPIRVEAWRARCARACAERAARAEVGWLVEFAAEAAEALAEPGPELEKEWETRGAAAPPVAATVRWPDTDSPELTAWFGGPGLALAA